MTERSSPDSAAEMLSLADEYEGEARAHLAMGDKEESTKCLRAAYALRKLAVPDAPAQGVQSTGVDRAAVTEAHEQIKQAIGVLSQKNMPVPMEIHRAAHALHHALQDHPTVPQGVPTREEIAKAIGNSMYGESNFRSQNLDGWNLSDVLPAADAVLALSRPLRSQGLAPGCCSASSPCAHQKMWPDSLCDLCQRSALSSQEQGK